VTSAAAAERGRRKTATITPGRPTEVIVEDQLRRFNHHQRVAE
jgi:hypothetical protein